MREIPGSETVHLFMAVFKLVWQGMSADLLHPDGRGPYAAEPRAHV